MIFKNKPNTSRARITHKLTILMSVAKLHDLKHADARAHFLNGVWNIIYELEVLKRMAHTHFKDGLRSKYIKKYRKIN